MMHIEDVDEGDGRRGGGAGGVRRGRMVRMRRVRRIGIRREMRRKGGSIFRVGKCRWWVGFKLTARWA